MSAQRLQSDSPWKLFPWAVVASMTFVVVVNVGMVVSAIETFPGKAGGDGFSLSNHYNAVLDRVHEQAALGWEVRAQSDRNGRPLVAVTDTAGLPLAGAHVQAVAQRPLGEPMETPLVFQDIGKGHHAADTVLPASGQWDLLLSIRTRDHDFVTTRRIVAK